MMARSAASRVRLRLAPPERDIQPESPYGDSRSVAHRRRCRGQPATARSPGTVGGPLACCTYVPRPGSGCPPRPRGRKRVSQAADATSLNSGEPKPRKEKKTVANQSRPKVKKSRALGIAL